MKAGDRMKKNWVKLIIIALSVFLVVINLYLILKDGSKIERSAYVKGWTTVAEEDIKQTLNKNGIVAPEEDYYYYYDPKMGAFKQFLIKEGEEVIGGTPLYEYFSTEIEIRLAKIEVEKEKIENQMIALQSHLKELTRYKNSISFNDEEKQAERSIVHSIERDIYDAELQLEWLRQDIEELEQELQLINEQELQLTVISNVDGIVKQVNESLESPLMTISSTSQIIKGNFNEDERYQVKDGIEAIISSKHIKGKMNGTLFNVSKLPTSSMPGDRKNESEYSFIVQIDDEAETELLHGSQVELSFITEAIDGALMVPKQAIVKDKKKSYVQIITTSGLLEKREIKTGLSSKNKIQIKSGVEKGELVVSKPQMVQKGEGPTLILPMDTSKLEISEIKKMRKKQIYKYIIKGILIR